MVSYSGHRHTIVGSGPLHRRGQWQWGSVSTPPHCRGAGGQWALGSCYTMLHWAASSGSPSTYHPTRGAVGNGSSLVHCRTARGSGSGPLIVPCHTEGGMGLWASFNTLPHCRGQWEVGLL